MFKYVLLLRADQRGSIGMLAAGAEFKVRCQQAIEAIGGQLHDYLPVMGRYDVVVIAALPTDVATFVLSNALNVAGLYAETLRALSDEEMADAEPTLRSLVALVQDGEGDGTADPGDQGESR